MTSLGPWLGRSNWPFSTAPYSSDVWDPWHSGGAIIGSRGDGDRGEDVATLTHANFDWRETDRSHIFTVDLPGERKEDLKVEVNISGDRVVETEEENDKWHRVERLRGSFSRRFRLPENADVACMKCGLDHGVLRVEVPKEEVQEKPRNVRYIDVA